MLVVPTLTRHDLLDRMLRSVDHPVGHLVVIDNSGPWDCGCRTGPWEQDDCAADAVQLWCGGVVEPCGADGSP
jgi:hypothetical protein